MALAKREIWLNYFALFVCGLALANLLFILVWLAGIHPHYWYVWRTFFWQAAIVFIAALALLSKRQWAYAVAALAVSPIIYDGIVGLLALWGYGPLATNEVMREFWWETVTRHPAEFVTPILALMILFYAIVKTLSGRRRPAAQDLP